MAHMPAPAPALTPPRALRVLPFNHHAYPYRYLPLGSAPRTVSITHLRSTGVTPVPPATMPNFPFLAAVTPWTCPFPPLLPTCSMGVMLLPPPAFHMPPTFPQLVPYVPLASAPAA